MRRSIWLTSLTLLLAAAPALAESPDGDAAAGREVAKRWCASCHDVTGHQAHVQPDVISFPEIARLKGVSMDSLIAIQSMPHIPMLDLDLSRRTKRDIAAYILSLKAR